MRRRMMTIFLALVLTLSLAAPAAALTGEAMRAADTLAALGLVSGTGSGYALEREATVEEGAVLAARMLGGSGNGTGTLSGAPAWAKTSLAFCVERGILRESEYTVAAPLSAELWCAMLLRAVGFDEHNGDFAPSAAALSARRVGLISQTLTGTLTRGKMFESALDALRYARTEESETLISALVSEGKAPQATTSALGLLSRTLTAREIADRYMSAAVQLELYYDEDAIAKGESSTSASAFFISEDGLAVTNFHSIDDAIYGTATLVTGEIADIESVVYYNRQMDLAVIRIAREDNDHRAMPTYRALKLVGGKEARVGDRVYTLSNPLGFGLTLSTGVIAATDHMVELSTQPCIISDAAISQGSSGGALVNEYGEVLGVTTGAYAKGNDMYIAVRVDPVMVLDLDRMSAEAITLRECVQKVDAEIKAEEAKEHNIVG